MKRSFACISLLAALLCGALPLLAAQAPAPGSEERRLAAEESRREAALIAAVKKAYTPPPAGIIPEPEDIPMSGAWEDPDWDSPLMQGIYKNPYSYGNNLDNYLPCLEEALGGNPKAMLALSMYYYLWGYVLEDSYPDFPAEVHSIDFWRDWAERLTSPGWVRLRLGDLHGRWPASSLEYYRQAAELGNAEAMYNYYKNSGKRRDYLYRSAALGYARAAFLLSEELEKEGGAENISMARRYIWLAALNADEWGLLHSSFSFYNNDFGVQGNSCEQGYLYALLNLRYQYGSAFSTQRPDNICMLAPDAVSRLEGAADRWQADYDQRRLPYILRGRYKREPHLAAMQDKLGPLMDRLGIARLATGNNASGSGSSRRSRSAGAPLPWHLGFYSESRKVEGRGEALGDLSAYSSNRIREQNAVYIPWVYGFVITGLVCGAVLLLYGQYAKRQKLNKHKGKAE